MNRKFKVIVADDEKLIANSIARNIEGSSEAFQVVAIVRDGLEAYEKTAELLPHVVFSDIKMPEMDGITLIEKLSVEFPSVKTVMVSGYSDFELARAALRHHAVDYLLKPCNPYELKRTLRKLEANLLAEQNQLAPRREDSALAIVESVMAFLRKNYGSQIDFSTIADQQGVSAPYLTKIFKEHAGATPSKYLTDCRIQKAKQLLQDTDLPVKNIALAVGFPDPFHFSKYFKNTVGKSPAQFREEG